jgi:hypothetical protein
MLQELRIHEKEQSKLERPFGRGILFQIESDNVHTMVGRLQEKGYVIKRAIRKSWFRNDDIEYGGLEFLVSDPDGYVLQFLEGIGERKA